MHIGHGLGLDASLMKQPGAGFDNRLLLHLVVGRRATVIAQVDPAQRLMLDHTGGRAVHTDVAQAAQQMQRRRQVFTQAVFHIEAVLQEHHFGVRRRHLGDGWRQVHIAGGLGAHQ
ncbi:hypothetical protein PFLmoz3_05080 [Pseudomonas fluorescens]|uniref:Uncharacterized protein n=1 Tax=Pseudomonas fluorescens TaxID=294 RepID=A0A120G647_PSEFL|nr:hypothetical protein PFLmoz3_05080 [Pseudomonas fluorescens]